MKKNYSHNEKSTSKEFDKVYQKISETLEESKKQKSIEISNGIPEEKNMKDGKFYLGLDSDGEMVIKIKYKNKVKILS